MTNHMENEDVNEDESKKDNSKKAQIKRIDIKELELEFPLVDVDFEFKKWQDWMIGDGKTYKRYNSAFKNWLRTDWVKKKAITDKNKIKLICPEHENQTMLVKVTIPMLVVFCPECRLIMITESEFSLRKIERNTK